MPQTPKLERWGHQSPSTLKAQTPEVEFTESGDVPAGFGSGFGPVFLHCAPVPPFCNGNGSITVPLYVGST